VPEANATIPEERPRGHLPFKPAHIYVLRDPDSLAVRYVGVTTQRPETRLGSHICDAKIRPTSHVRRWIAQLLARGQSPVMEVIETVPPGAWCSAERRWIAHYRKVGARLTNLTDGGDGTHGLVITDAHRAALSRAHTGSKRTPAQRANMSIAAKKRGVHPVTREKAKIALRRETRSPETLEKQRRINLGRKFGPRSDDVKAKISAKNLGKPGLAGAENGWSRAVVIDGTRYSTVTEAARQLGLTQPAISVRLSVGTAQYATDTGNPAADAEATRLNAVAAAKFAARTDGKLRPVVVGGTRFPSLKAAASHCGIHPSSMIERIQKGRAHYATD
jgi:hypothetical protein